MLSENDINPNNINMQGPLILICFSDKEDVSERNRRGQFYHNVFAPTNSEFRIPLSHIILKPSSGQTYYYVAYGKSGLNIDYDYENKDYDSITGYSISYSPLLGKPSNVISITVNN